MSQDSLDAVVLCLPLQVFSKELLGHGAPHLHTLNIGNVARAGQVQPIGLIHLRACVAAAFEVTLSTDGTLQVKEKHIKCAAFESIPVSYESLIHLWAATAAAVGNELT